MSRATLTIDTSPAGSWRAELARRAGAATACAACHQAVCRHTDAEYQPKEPERDRPSPDR